MNITIVKPPSMGGAYYRLYAPLQDIYRFLNRKVNIRIINLPVLDKDYIRELVGTDVLMMSMPTSPDEYNLIAAANMIGNIISIVDVDDIPHVLPEHHPSYTPSAVEYLNRCITDATTITVSTPEVAIHVGSLSHRGNVYILESYVPGLAIPRPPVREKDGKVRIVIRGTPSREADYNSYADLIVTMSERCDLYMIGYRPNWAIRPSIKHIGMQPPAHYLVSLVHVQADILFQPLQDIPFNTFRSGTFIHEAVFASCAPYTTLSKWAGPCGMLTSREHLSEHFLCRGNIEEQKARASQWAESKYSDSIGQRRALMSEIKQLANL